MILLSFHQKFCLIVLMPLFLGGLIFDSFGEEETLNEKPRSPSLTDPDLEIKLFQTGLDFPTQMTFIDDETILVAQKYNGKVAVIKNFELQKSYALDLDVEAGRERGLVGLTSVNLHGEIFVYVYYTESVYDYDTQVLGNKEQGNENNGNKLVRYRWNGTSLVEPVLILHPLPYANAVHNGGAMIFFEDTLFLVIGDNHEKNSFLINGELSQSIDHGVILRVTFDGEPVPSNPFNEQTLSKYYAYGIRNGYGLDIDPVTGNLWDTENGPAEFDEVNLVFPGFNSGWNKIMGPNGEGLFSSDITKLNSFEGSEYSDPEFSWRKTVGLTGIEFLKSNKLGVEYQYDVFIGDIRGNLYHLELNEERNGFVFSDVLLHDFIADTQDEAESITIGKNLGVITDIKTGPDGFLYILSLVKGVNEWEDWEKPLRTPTTIEEGELMGVLFRINKKWEGSMDISVLSPKQQIAIGFLPLEVKCKPNFELILKSKNNSPNCVTSETAEKLIARNWGY